MHTTAGVNEDALVGAHDYVNERKLPEPVRLYDFPRAQGQALNKEALWDTARTVMAHGGGFTYGKSTFPNNKQRVGGGRGAVNHKAAGAGCAAQPNGGRAPCSHRSKPKGTAAGDFWDARRPVHATAPQGRPLVQAGHLHMSTQARASEPTSPTSLANTTNRLLPPHALQATIACSRRRPKTKALGASPSPKSREL